ncbi:MAG: DNA-directed RNA polymerase subunit omega [Armatimonadetes bacterium]|nr:DNA-directed RNA polymerase subunit omega [Armatimonadota bacterium]
MRRKSDHELILENGGKYALVMGITRRARQLTEGARPLIVKTTLNNVATAVEEVALGRLRITAPEKPVKKAALRALPAHLQQDA